MKLVADNLPPAVRQSAREDIYLVRRLARGRGVPLPDLQLCVVSLEDPGPPSGLPAHAVRRPASDPPTAFQLRCDWETQRQSFQLIRRGRTLWVVAGGREGALYGIDEALECLTGVIWAGLRDEDILFGPKRPMPETVQSPSFPYRFRDGSGPDRADDDAYCKWLSRNRFNGRVHGSENWARFTPEERRRWLARFEARAMHVVVGYHAMRFFLPEEEFRRHPGWFGMRDGKRVRNAHVRLPEAPHLDAELPIQPCYSNAEFADYLTDRMAAHVKAFPEIEIFSLWPHDGINNWCQCPDCLGKTPYEWMYRLALRLAQKIPATVPIELIVYANLITPPTTPLPASDRVISMLCPYLRHYTHRIYEPGGPKLVMGMLYPEPDRVNPVDDRDYGKLFRLWQPVWRQSGSVPGIFEYGQIAWPDETYRTERQRYMYHPRSELRFDEARWYHRRGVRYFYMCTVFAGWPDAAFALAEGRCLWNCRDDASVLEARYYAALAGRLGVRLRRALAGVSAALDADRSPIPAVERLERLLSRSPRARWSAGYRLWCQYVRRGSVAREAERAGDPALALRTEKRLGAWFKRIAPRLGANLNSGMLLCYSRVRQERLQSRLTGVAAKGYHL